MQYPSILLVALDRCRPDRMGCYGHHRPTTPNLDRVAERGVLFTHAFASRSPGELGLEDLLGESVCLSSVLAEKGYVCRAVLPDRLASSLRGTWDSVLPMAAQGISGKVSGAHLAEQAIAQWESSRRGGSPLFLLLVLEDPAAPYSTAPPHYLKRYQTGIPGDEDPRMDRFFANHAWREHCLNRPHPDACICPEGIRNLEWHLAAYDACLKAMDDALERLLQRAELDLTLVSSLCGEPLGEQGVYFCPGSLHDSTQRIALMVRWPGQVFEGIVTDRMVCHRDLVPTVMEILGASLTDAGQSFAPALKGSLESGRDVLRMSHSSAVMQRGVRTREWKLTLTSCPGPFAFPELSLVNLCLDPLEEKDVSGVHPEVVEALREE